MRERERGLEAAIIELAARTAQNILTSPLIVLFVLGLMPLVEPRRLGFFFFTYVVPVLPWLILWDGLVSHLRAYDDAELAALTDPLQRDDYRFEVRKLPVGKGLTASVLIGLPSA